MAAFITYADRCGETAAQRAALKERHDERVLELANRAETAERRTAALEAQHAEQQHEKLNEKLAVHTAETRGHDIGLQPPSVTYGCSPRHIGLQPPSHTDAACVT